MAESRTQKDMEVLQKFFARFAEQQGKSEKPKREESVSDFSGFLELVPGYEAPAKSKRFAGNEIESVIPKFADLRGSITPGSAQPAATNLGEGTSLDAAERFRAGAGYPAGITRPADYPVTAQVAPTAPSTALPSPPRSNMADKSELERMTAFVKANRGLAEKVKPGQAGYEEIQIALGRMPFMPDAVQTFKSTDEGVTNPAEAAKALGIDKLYDAQAPVTKVDPQAFANTAVMNFSDALKMGTLLPEGETLGVASDVPEQFLTPETQAAVRNGFTQEPLVPSVKGLNLRTGGTDIKPIIVDDKDIPRGEEEFNKYLARLDKGELTRRNPYAR